MSFAPARPRWPLSALHSLASSTQSIGPCLQTSLSPCLLASKPTINKQICTNSSYNINKQKAHSNNPRHLSGKTDRLRSDRDSRQKQYPWRGEEEESEKLPWQKESASPKKHNGPYSLKNTSRDKKKTNTRRDKQNIEFNSSRGRLSFGNGPIMPTALWMQGWSNVPIKDIKKNAGKNKEDLDSDNDDFWKLPKSETSRSRKLPKSETSRKLLIKSR